MFTNHFIEVIWIAARATIRFAVPQAMMSLSKNAIFVLLRAVDMVTMARELHGLNQHWTITINHSWSSSSSRSCKKHAKHNSWHNSPHGPHGILASIAPTWPTHDLFATAPHRPSVAPCRAFRCSTASRATRCLRWPAIWWSFAISCASATPLNCWSCFVGVYCGWLVVSNLLSVFF